jgi:hypothetical protein
VEPIVEILHAWHDFFVTMATAAATLIGAMFVVMSIGSGVLTADRTPQIRTFYTTTVVHLSGVLLAGLLTMVPSLERMSLAALLAIGGLIGLVFCIAQLPIIRRHRADLVLEDRFWYAGAPIAAYLVILAAAFCVATARKGSLELLGFALVLLLLAGIRNAWDMIVFLVIKRRDGP